MIQQFYFWVLSKENENTNLKGYLYLHVHCSIVHNNQHVETTKCPSVDEWIKKNVIYI